MRIVILPIFLVCFGCTSPTGDSQRRLHPIIGDWNWILSDGGELGRRTPESEGYRMIYRFSIQNIFYGFRNDTLLFQSPYRVVRDRVSPFMSDSSDVLIVDDWAIKWLIEFSTTDTLTLRALAFDREYSTFIRQHQ